MLSRPLVAVALVFSLAAPTAQAQSFCGRMLSVAGQLRKALWNPPSNQRIATASGLSEGEVERVLDGRRRAPMRKAITIGGLLAFGGHLVITLVRDFPGARNFLTDHYSNFAMTGYGVALVQQVVRETRPSYPVEVSRALGFGAGVAVNAFVEGFVDRLRYQTWQVDWMDALAGVLGTSVAVAGDVLYDRWLRVSLLEELTRGQ